MTATPLYHYGILVTDLDAAMARFSEELGITFGEPRVVALEDLVERGLPVERRDLRLVYSVEGPPFVELIESQDGGIWGHHHGEGLHHIGTYHDDLPAKLAQLLAAGTPPESLVRRDGEIIAIYQGGELVHDTRIEFVRKKV